MFNWFRKKVSVAQPCTCSTTTGTVEIPQVATPPKQPTLWAVFDRHTKIWLKLKDPVDYDFAPKVENEETDLFGPFFDENAVEEFCDTANLTRMGVVKLYSSGERIYRHKAGMVNPTTTPIPTEEETAPAPLKGDAAQKAEA